MYDAISYTIMQITISRGIGRIVSIQNSLQIFAPSFFKHLFRARILQLPLNKIIYKQKLIRLFWIWSEAFLI